MGHSSVPGPEFVALAIPKIARAVQFRSVSYHVNFRGFSIVLYFLQKYTNLI